MNVADELNLAQRQVTGQMSRASGIRRPLAVAPAPADSASTPESAWVPHRHRVRDHNGVLLDYGDPGAKHPYHDDTSPKPSDRLRADLIAAEAALQSLRLMLECAHFNECALRRVDARIDRVRWALDWQRAQVGLTLICPDAP